MLDGARLRAEVVVAVPEPEAALHEEGAVGRLAVDAVLDGEPEDRRRGVDAEVERIHVGVHRAAEQASEREPVADAVDAGEQRRERGDPFASMADSFRKAARKSATLRASEPGGAVRASSRSAATCRRVSSLISSRTAQRSLPAGITAALSHAPLA